MRNIALTTCKTERLLAQLAMRSVADIAQFWHEAATIGLPLVVQSAAGRDERDVTFLWRAEKPLQGVYLSLNRVTDKERVGQGMLERIPASDIWMLTLRLPAAYCGSYTFTEIPPETPTEQLSQLGTRRPPFPGQADPLNSTPGIRVRGNRESVLALDQAPAQKEWAVTGAPRGTLTVSCPVVAGKSRRVRLWLPDTDNATPLGLLVLPDAESWFDHVGVLAALDAAIASGRIAPLAVLGIDNLDEADRAAILAGNRELITDVAERLVPQARADHPERVWAGRARTVLCGQSLGGITALMAAVHAPETFGAVISSSPSMWWMPDNSRRPAMFKDTDVSWVSEHVLAALPSRVKIRLCIGSLEGTMVPHVHQLHQRLIAAGVESTLRVYTGGHDYAWWRGALIDGLEGGAAQQG